jgi:lipid A 4'-phosphatase
MRCDMRLERALAFFPAKGLGDARMPSGANPVLRRAGELPKFVGIVALLFSLISSIIFSAFPGMDLEVSRAFYAGNHVFAGQFHGWVKFIRGVFFGAFYMCIGFTIMGLVFTRRDACTWFRFGFRNWVFLAVCLAAGPGLVANVVFKDHWGRARPHEVVEFGGKKAFTPAVFPADQCDTNCSFVSGEAASMFLPFYALGLLVPQRAALLLIAGTVCGLTAGLLRVSQGAHFLSDVIFAGIFMALSVVVVHLVVFRRRPASGQAADDTISYLADSHRTFTRR